eukprot:s155_g2.t1
MHSPLTRIRQRVRAGPVLNFGAGASAIGEAADPVVLLGGVDGASTELFPVVPFGAAVGGAFTGGLAVAGAPQWALASPLEVVLMVVEVALGLEVVLELLVPVAVELAWLGWVSTLAVDSLVVSVQLTVAPWGHGQQRQLLLTLPRWSHHWPQETA